MEFLLTTQYEGVVSSTVTDANGIIHFIDMKDLDSSLEDYCIHLIDETKAPLITLKPLHYRGWQPDCLIEIADDDGNIIISGRGTDY